MKWADIKQNDSDMSFLLSFLFFAIELKETKAPRRPCREQGFRMLGARSWNCRWHRPWRVSELVPLHAMLVFEMVKKRLDGRSVLHFSPDLPGHMALLLRCLDF